MMNEADQVCCGATFSAEPLSAAGAGSGERQPATCATANYSRATCDDEEEGDAAAATGAAAISLFDIV